MKLEQWLEDLAAKQATPGGGAAAGLAAATAASLIGMVSIYTTGTKWQDREATMQLVHSQAATLRQQALDLMDADEAAFQAVGTAYALPKDTEDQKQARQEAIQVALLAAAQPPRQTAVVATEIITMATNLVSQCNPNVISDIAVAASFAKAALEAAIVNIEINAQLINDEAAVQELQQAVDGCTAAISQAEVVVAAVRTKLGKS